MASFSLVHGAWGGGWCWDELRPELEARGHQVHTPDLPCDVAGAEVADYLAVIPPADVVVGHSLGGVTIPYVDARLHVFLCALVGGTGWAGVFATGFGRSRAYDEHGRSWYPDAAAAAREHQLPPGLAHLAARLRPQAPYDPPPREPAGARAYVVCARDAVIRPEWQRHLARDVLGVEPIELDAGHSPMLECPGELAAILDSLV